MLDNWKTLAQLKITIILEH